ncbi:hypothetical protein [uncultured Thiodictyon sp.]|jgi:hypothetical protein|uniref:hypothetical protein n=1 Tax=uncultured Thiodictyon sp. TaxID=1846217 RepID=UPI0025F1997F|nr:hypothetical protein [uncultured Thiodictyon sp.]
MTRMAAGTAEPAAVFSRLGTPEGTHLWLGGHGIRLRLGDGDARVIAQIHALLLRLLLGRATEKRQVTGKIHEVPARSLTFYGVCGDAQACVHDFPEQVRRHVEVYYRDHRITVETRPFPLTMSAGTRVRDEVADQFNQDLSVTQVRPLRAALEAIPVVPPDAKDKVVIALSWLLEPGPGFTPAQLPDWLAQRKRGLLDLLGHAQVPASFRIFIGACIQWPPDWPGSDPGGLQRRIDQTLERTEPRHYVHCIRTAAPGTCATTSTPSPTCATPISPRCRCVPTQTRRRSRPSAPTRAICTRASCGRPTSTTASACS